MFEGLQQASEGLAKPSEVRTFTASLEAWQLYTRCNNLARKKLAYNKHQLL